MRTLLFSILLFSLSCVAALSVGCGEATVAKAPELDVVDAAGLESALKSNAVTLIDFTADW